MEPAVLLNMPKGKEFEELVSACLQTKGNYVQRNIEEHKKTPLLELDVIVTDYSSGRPRDCIVEAKSGDWGAKDIFKIKGWMCYTGISKGVLLAATERPHPEVYESVASRLEIGLGIAPRAEEVPVVIKRHFGVCLEDELDLHAWRFSYWMERNMLSYLQQMKKKSTNCKRFTQMLRYYDEVTNGIFFAPTPARRLWRLYRSFEACPRITSKCAHEMVGHRFDDEYHDLPKQLFTDTFYKCSVNELSISCFIEYRSRLSVLKSAVDLLLSIRDKEGAPTHIDQAMLFAEFPELKELPILFVMGLCELYRHRHISQYPVFWQWFTWLFGGFVLLDYKEKEYQLLSEKTGIPVDAIPDAMQAYEILFPRDQGWFIEPQPWNSYSRQMHMFPLPFRGVGSLYRVHKYSGGSDYSKLSLTGNYAKRDLQKWHQAGYCVLKGRWS